MRLTSKRSKHLDESLIVNPDTQGQVAWSQFNHHYHALQTTPWSKINRGRDIPWYRRIVRLLMAFVISKNDAIMDLRGKATWFSRMPIPRDPNIVFFGAEVGWEAALLQALYGDGGRVVLIDNDAAAYERFLRAPQQLTIRAPRGFGAKHLTIARNPERIDYVRADLFDYDSAREFDVGIDWGLIEHFSDPRKLELMRTMQRFLRPDGVQISAVPRDSRTAQSFYWAFCDELNFGYRELLTRRELLALLERGGYTPIRTFSSPSTCVACSRVEHS